MLRRKVKIHSEIAVLRWYGRERKAARRVGCGIRWQLRVPAICYVAVRIGMKHCLDPPTLIEVLLSRTFGNHGITCGADAFYTRPRASLAQNADRAVIGVTCDSGGTGDGGAKHGNVVR